MNALFSHRVSRFLPAPEPVWDSSKTQAFIEFCVRRETVPLSRLLSRLLSRSVLFDYNRLKGLSRCPALYSLTYAYAHTQGKVCGTAGQRDNNNNFLFLFIYINKIVSKYLVPHSVPLFDTCGTGRCGLGKSIKYSGDMHG